MYVINEDIKNKKLKSVYLLTGQEDYLISQFRDKLLFAFTGKKSVRDLQGDMNFACFTGKETDMAKVFDFAETMPFLAERRVILLEDMEYDAEAGTALAEYFSRKPEYASFILVERSLAKNSRIYRECEKAGHVAEFKEQNEDMLRRWIVGMIRAEGKNITNGALNELLNRVGFDMFLLSKEVEKLLTYCLDKEAVEQKDVEALVSPRIGNHIFVMIESMGNKNRQKALELYYELLELKEPPMKILNLLGRQFSNLYAVKELREKGFDKKKIAEKMEIKPFIADKYLGQAGKFSLEQLKNAIRDCADYDAMVKNGGIKDQMCVELLLIKYSS